MNTGERSFFFFHHLDCSHILPAAGIKTAGAVFFFFFWEITHTSLPFFPEWKERENKNLRRGPSLLFTLKKHFCTSPLHHNNIAIKIHLFSFSVDPTCGPISTLHFLSILKRCLGKWYFVSRVWGRFLSVRNDSGFPTQKRWMLGKNT